MFSENFFFRWRHLLLEIFLLYKFHVSCKFRYILPPFLFVYQVSFDFSLSFHFSSLAVQVHINFRDIVSGHDPLSGHLIAFGLTKFLSLTLYFQESYNIIDSFSIQIRTCLFSYKNHDRLLMSSESIYRANIAIAYRVSIASFRCVKTIHINSRLSIELR